jgi:alpha-beta hydrolase superfamily lysophospholipase
MAYNTRTLTSKDQQELHIHHWSVPQPIAQLVIVHGFAEHGYRYEHVGRALNEANIEVYSYDHRGHGKSGGLQSYVDRFKDYTDDLSAVLHAYRPNGIPQFLFGHSMGGLISVNYCVNYDESTELAGLITSGAALKIDKDLSPVLQKLAPLLSKLLPKLKTEPLEKATLTRSPEVLDAYMKDPLVYTGGIRARLGAELLAAIKRTDVKFDQLTLPYLGMHGMAEKIADPAGTKELYERCQSSDKTIKLYEDLYHELVNEPEREGVIQDLKDWILERIK